MTNMMPTGQPSNAADRTDAMVKLMGARLESLKTIAAAEKALYAVLSDAQKKTADDLLSGPMMGMGGPMMGMGPMMGVGGGPMMGVGQPDMADIIAYVRALQGAKASSISRTACDGG
jgi:hypothetical protein